MKILFLLVTYVTMASQSFALGKDSLLVGGGSNSANADTGVQLKGNFLTTIQSYLVAAYGISAVAVFVFIGYKLFTASGNEADFKQAWIAFLYAAVGLAVAPLAYAVVKIIIGYSIS